MKQVIHTGIEVSGRVQGVGFRQSAVYKANQLQVKGYVKNMPSGKVQIEAEGDPESVNELIRWCHQGPVMARVESVRTWEGAVQGYSGFSVS